MDGRRRSPARLPLLAAAWPTLAVPLLGLAVVAAIVMGELGRVTMVVALGGVVLLVWAWPKAGVILLMLVVFFVDWAVDELDLLPRYATLASEIILLVLGLRVLLGIIARGRIVGTGIDGAVILLLVLALGSAVAHDIPAFRVALGLRGLFKFMLMFYVLVNLRLGERFYRWSIVLLVGLVFLQIPITVWQFAALGLRDDRVSGSLRSTGILTILLIFVICLLVALFVRHRPRPIYLLATFGLFFMPVIGEAKGFFFLLPPTLFFLFRRTLLASPIRAAGALAVMALPFFAAAALFGSVEGNEEMLPVVLEPSRFFTDQSIGVSATSRVGEILVSHAEVSRSPETFLVGYGLGSRTFAFSDVAKFTSAVLYHAPLAGRIYELGYLGTALYFLMHYQLLRRAVRLRRVVADRFWRAVCFAFPGAVFAFVAGMAYTEVAEKPVAFAFWFLAAAVHTAGASRQTAPAPAPVGAEAVAHS